jgi:hypothetical protein
MVLGGDGPRHRCLKVVGSWVMVYLVQARNGEKFGKWRLVNAGRHGRHAQTMATFISMHLFVGQRSGLRKRGLEILGYVHPHEVVDIVPGYISHPKRIWDINNADDGQSGNAGPMISTSVYFMCREESKRLTSLRTSR